MSLSLFLRKRRVLLVIFLCSFTYFVITTYKQLKRRVVEEEEEIHKLKIDEILRNDQLESDHLIPDLPEAAQSIHRSLLELNTTVGKVYKCRNSVQGRSLVADINGYVCDRFDLETNGCCRVNAPSTKRYTCDSCSNSGCCSQYEGCVSCCLHPQKVGLAIHSLAHCYGRFIDVTLVTAASHQLTMYLTCNTGIA